MALSKLGVYFGEPEQLIPADEHNTDGYWENRVVRVTTESFFDRLGLPAYEVKPLPRFWHDIGEFDQHLRETAAAMQKVFGKAVVWGYKDPILSPAVEYVDRVFDRLKRPVLYAVCVRDPLSVAESTFRRSQVPHLFTIGTWAGLTLRALVGTIGHRRVVVDHSALLADPQKVIREVAGRLSGLEPSQDQWKEAFASIRPTSVHHHPDPEALSQLPDLIGRIHRASIEAAADPDGLNDGRFDDLFRALLHEFDQWSAIMHGPHDPRHTVALTQRRSNPNRVEEVVRATGEWQTVELEVVTEKGEDFALMLTQIPCCVWIKSAEWKADGKRIKAELKEGRMGTLVPYGQVHRLWPALGPEQIVVRAPWTGPCQFSIEFAILATHQNMARIYAAMSFERDMMRSRFGTPPMARQPFLEA